MNVAKIKKHSKGYPDKFLKEKDRVSGILEKYSDEILIEHIGSTAIPGLGGKGVVDIAIALKDFGKVGEVIRLLEASGLFYKESAGSAKRRFLSDKPLSEKNVSYHYQLMPIESEEYKNAILFRDYLRNNPKSIVDYFELKKSLATKAKSPRDYLLGKNDFITKIIAQSKAIITK